MFYYLIISCPKKWTDGFFFSSRRRHTRWNCDWSSDVCSSDLVAPLLVAALAGLASADEPPLPEVAAALARIQDRSTIDLTTTGRKTAKEHTKPIWFVVSDGKIIVQAGQDGKADWY